MSLPDEDWPNASGPNYASQADLDRAVKILGDTAEALQRLTGQVVTLTDQHLAVSGFVGTLQGDIYRQDDVLYSLRWQILALWTLVGLLTVALIVVAVTA